MKNKKPITVGLIGNPNTGKTSLLNSLTGLSLHVGNWPGKTVEKKECRIRFQGKCIKIVDLPGTYSIAPYSEEERISRDFIINEKPDVIVQTVDVNTLKRHLLMTFELLALNKNIVLAFNFNNEAKKRNIKVDVEKLKKELKLPIVQIEANTGENKEELLRQIIIAAHKKPGTPAYLSKLMRNNREINHHRALSFINKEIKPHYTDSGKDSQTNKIDSFILNKYSCLPIFVLVMFLIFGATFNLSLPLVNMVENLFEQLAALIRSLGLSMMASSFLTEGLIGGLGSILSFTPLIFILFFFIALLEDSGYLARTVVLSDKLFHRVGISGHVFIPMMLGLGCNVPAIMAARTIKNEKEKKIAIFINSFVSCGARLPIYVLFTGIFFPDHAGLVISVLYASGIAVAFVLSFFLSKLIKTGEKNRLIIELPPYRMPVLANVFKHALFQTGLFVRKAGTIILIAIIVVWFLASMPTGIEYGSESSFLGQFGKSIAPVFKPLGFGHWTFSISLLFGLIAKETVVSTLGALYGAWPEGLTKALPYQITKLGALSFLFFALLYTPCLATIAVIKKETGSWRFALIQIMTAVLIAWGASFLIYNAGLAFGFG